MRFRGNKWSAYGHIADAKTIQVFNTEIFLLYGHTAASGKTVQAFNIEIFLLYKLRNGIKIKTGQ